MVHESNIACGEPSLWINSLSGLLFVLVVALKDACAPYEDLTTRVGLVGREVVHFRYIREFDLDARAWATNMTWDVFAGRDRIRLTNRLDGHKKYCSSLISMANLLGHGDRGTSHVLC